MDTKNTRNKKKKSNPIGLIILIMVILANVGEIGSGVSSIIIALAVVAASIVGFVILFRKLKNKPAQSSYSSSYASAGVSERAAWVRNTAISARERSDARKSSSSLHSHDRASGYVNGSCTPEEHWKRQLDGFLANGIIDRAEYRFLMKKRTGADINR